MPYDCLRTKCSAVGEAQTPNPQSRVTHSTTGPLCSPKQQQLLQNDKLKKVLSLSQSSKNLDSITLCR